MNFSIKINNQTMNNSEFVNMFVSDNMTTFDYNVTDFLLEYTPYSQRAETYIVPIVFAIIFVAGVIGNGTLVIVFIRHRAIRNVPNTYILSLALADLIVITTCVPFTSTIYTVESWPWGIAICRISEAVKDVSIGVSVFTLTALSADRYFAIVDPLKRLHTTGGSRRATRCTIAVTMMIWLLAIICAAPVAISSHIKVFQVNLNTEFSACYPYPERWGAEYARIMVLARFLVYYSIPLTAIALFYILMARHLVLSVKNVPGEVQGTRMQVRARQKVAVMVLVFVMVFAICFLPYHIFMLWFYYSPNAPDDYNAGWHAFRIVGFCLTFINSCINPMALYMASGTFRKHFNHYLLCRTRCQEARDNISNCTGSVGKRGGSFSLSTTRGPRNNCQHRISPVKPNFRSRNYYPSPISNHRPDLYNGNDCQLYSSHF